MNKKTRISTAESESKVNALIIKLSQSLWKDLEYTLDDNIPSATRTEHDINKL